MRSKHKEEKSKRYYLHTVVRKQGFKLNSYKKTIFIPFNDTTVTTQVLKLLNNYGYSIQTEIG